MRILFNENQLSNRGTTVSTFNYAHYSETLLSHTSYIAAPISKELSSLEKFQERFEGRVLLYSSVSELEAYVEAQGIDLVYSIKYGTKEPLLNVKAKQVVHAVFNAPYEQNKHGDRYAYVSQWLSEVNGGAPYVPHIVEMPEAFDNYREYLGIPKDNVVVVRTGGADTFDIKYAQEVVYKIASSDPRFTFLFLNTSQFCPTLPNIIHVEPTTDKEVISYILATGDLFLHSRERGESFGLSVAEALYMNLPVVSCINGIDRNHIKMVGDKGLYYSSAAELEAILKGFRPTGYNYSQLVSQFSPEEVMAKFDATFIK